MISDERLSFASDRQFREARFRENERILKTKDFARVYKSGRRVVKDAVVLYILPNVFQYSRIGFSISSRNIKLATRRNRIRRLIREVFRKKKKELKSGHDLVFVIKKDPARHISYKDIEAIFLELIKNAGLFLP